MSERRIYYSQEAERIAKRQRLLTIVLFMALGLGLGAAIALLFAPDEGEKTRRLIAEAAQDGFRRGREATADALRQLEPEFPDLRKRVDELISSVRH
jgi:gas vesicle protein